MIIGIGVLGCGLLIFFSLVAAWYYTELTCPDGEYQTLVGEEFQCSSCESFNCLDCDIVLDDNEVTSFPIYEYT